VYEECDLDAVLDVELAPKPRDVRLDGRHRDVQLAGDVGVRAALADSKRDLALALRQQVEGAVCLSRPAGAVGGRSQRRREAEGRKQAREDEPGNFCDLPVLDAENVHR
jgi:hypothetical protein